MGVIERVRNGYEKIETSSIRIAHFSQQREFLFFLILNNTNNEAQGITMYITEIQQTEKFRKTFFGVIEVYIKRNLLSYRTVYKTSIVRREFLKVEFLKWFC